MAGFQVFKLAGPAADVSKILYGESRKSYQCPNAQYDNSGAIPRNAEERQYNVHRVGPHQIWAFFHLAK